MTESNRVANPVDAPRRGRFNRVAVALTGIGLLLVVTFFAGGKWIRMYVNESVTHARRLLSQGHVAESRSVVGQILWIDPQNAEAILIEGNALLRQSAFAEAAAVLSRIPPNSPHHQAADASRINCLLGDYQLAAAEVALNDHLRLAPDDVEMREQLQWLYFNELRVRDVHDFLEEELKSNRNNLTTLMSLLMTEFRRQLPRDGLPYLETANRAHPDQAPVVLALAKCHWKLSDEEQARRLFERAVDLRPDDLETRLSAAEFLIEQNQLDGADFLLNQSGATEKSISDDRWWALNSRLAQSRGFYQKSLDALQRALLVRPRELAYLERQSSLLRLVGRSDEAARVAKAASDIGTSYAALNEIVLSGALNEPDLRTVRRTAELCETCGWTRQAQAWRGIADRLESVSLRNVESLVPGSLSR